MGMGRLYNEEGMRGEVVDMVMLWEWGGCIMKKGKEFFFKSLQIFSKYNSSFFLSSDLKIWMRNSSFLRICDWL